MSFVSLIFSPRPAGYGCVPCTSKNQCQRSVGSSRNKRTDGRPRPILLPFSLTVIVDELYAHLLAVCACVRACERVVTICVIIIIIIMQRLT